MGAGPRPDRGYLGELIRYWLHDFDWRSQEAKINRLAQFRASIEGLQIHFIHERGKGANPFPLILTHGYPDSFCRFAKIIPMLTDPESFGGRAEDAFHVVVPDLTGYGFSVTDRGRSERSFASTTSGRD